MNENNLNNHNDKIMVSVFSLCYNHENYIHKCLDGFVMQETNFNFEVLVHDDASTDNSAKIIKKYAKKYPNIIKPIYQTQNQYSQNVPIFDTFILPKAKGRYIAFCECDDFWTDKHKLQLQFDALESHPECSLSVHKVQCCNEDGSTTDKTYPPSWVIDKHSLNKSRILHQNEVANILWKPLSYSFQTSCFFLKKEVLEIDLEYPFDYGILKKSLCVGDYYYIDKTMSSYRLFSKGSWNEKWNNDANNVIDTFYPKIIKYDNNLDIYTNNKYHNLIYLANLERMTRIGNSKTRRQVKKKYKLYLYKLLLSGDKNNYFRLQKSRFRRQFEYWYICLSNKSNKTGKVIKRIYHCFNKK